LGDAPIAAGAGLAYISHRNSDQLATAAARVAILFSGKRSGAAWD
jgi:hypothetical protein